MRIGEQCETLGGRLRRPQLLRQAPGISRTQIKIRFIISSNLNSSSIGSEDFAPGFGAFAGLFGNSAEYTMLGCGC